jgi:hypothetical protein
MASLKYNNVEIDFGTGSDGALTVNAANSPYIITTNKNFTNVTVAAGGVLVISRPINATFNGTITANSTALTVAAGSVTGTITAGDELSGGAVKLGTTIASGSGLNWTLSQNQFSTIPSGGVFVSSLQSIGPMPLVKISGTLTVSPAAGATAAGIIRGDYQDDVTLPFVNSGSGVEFIRNSAAYDGYNNVYFKNGTAQQWPGAWFGRNGGFNNPDNSIFSHQEEYIAGSGWRSQDRYGGDYGRNPAGGGGGAGYSNGTSGQNSVNNFGSQPGGAGGYQNPNNPRPSSVSLTNYYDNISILYDGHRGGNAGDSSTSRGRGGRSLRIIARYIINNGFITASGENAVSVGMGGGGGGGAGTIVVFCETENGSGTYEAKGGLGGAGDGSWPAGFGGQGGGGTIQRFVGVTYFTGTINTTVTNSYTGNTTGIQTLNGLTYVPDTPLVLIDAVTSSSVAASAQSVSFSHTVGTSSNRLLTAMIQLSSNDVFVTSVNYAGAGMSKLYSAYSENNRLEVWYLVNPSSGSGNIQVNCSATTRIEYGAISWFGANQSNPFRSVSSQTAGLYEYNGTSPETRGWYDYSSTNDVICCFCSTESDMTISMNTTRGGNNQISRWLASGSSRTAALTKAPTIATDNTAWTLSSASNWCTIQFGVANASWDGSNIIPNQTFLGATRLYSVNGTNMTSTASAMNFYFTRGGEFPTQVINGSTVTGTYYGSPKPLWSHGTYVQTSGYSPAGYNGFFQVNSNTSDQTYNPSYFTVTSTANPGTAVTYGTISSPAIWENCPNNKVTSGTFLKILGSTITFASSALVIISGIVHFSPSTSFNLNGATLNGNGTGLYGGKNSGVNWYYYSTSHGGSTVLNNFPYKPFRFGKGNNVGNLISSNRHLFEGTVATGLTLLSYISYGQISTMFTYGYMDGSYPAAYSSSYWYGVVGNKYDTYDGGSIGNTGGAESLYSGGGGGGNGGNGGDGYAPGSNVKATGGSAAQAASLLYSPFIIGPTVLTLTNNNGGVLKHGYFYKIITPGTTTFTTMGSSSNAAGTYFQANTISQVVPSSGVTGYETGGGTVTPWPPHLNYSYQSGSTIYDVWIFKAGVRTITTSTGFNADVLIVGGGGSGGSTRGGGGGGGAVISKNLTFASGTSYTITVGAGGQKSSGYSGATAYTGGYGGQASSIIGGSISETALGGGGGGGYDKTYWGTNVGGGPGGGQGAGGGAGQPAGTGFLSGGTSSNNTYGGGGGAGSSTAGSNYTANKGGDGGDGTVSSITGYAVIYGAGGGGGVINNASWTGGKGGQNKNKYTDNATGGFGGDNANGGLNGNPGTRGSGSGGGGGAGNSTYGDNFGGFGADGTVIIRIARTQFSNNPMFNLGNQISMGAGGGPGNARILLAAGNAYAGVDGGDGGNGGAAIVITTLTFSGSGSITCNGEIGHPAGTNYYLQRSDVDGHSSFIAMSGCAGGGGAGGTIYVRSKFYYSSASLSAVGGTGGSNTFTDGGDYRPGSWNGVGGGGGGGIVLVGSELFAAGSSTVSSSTVAAGSQGTNGGTAIASPQVLAASVGIYEKLTVPYTTGGGSIIFWY